MYSSIKYLDKSLAAIYNSSFVIEANTNLDLNEIKAYEIKDNPHYHGIENEKKIDKFIDQSLGNSYKKKS